MEATGATDKIHLGWQRPPLDAATDWLVKRFGKDMQDVLVALPGARSGRLLIEALAKKSGAGLRPPRVITAGVLSDELLEPSGVPAGRLTRTLAWAAALREINSTDLHRIVARPPEADDLGAWWRLAEEVRGLFGEVAAEGLDFGAIGENEGLPAPEGERKRWLALAAAQREMEAQLESAGVVDPHLGRLRAIREGRAARIGTVVLIGVVEMNALLRRALELCSSQVTALVFAPEEDAETFDEWGCLRPEVWGKREVNLPFESWKVVDRPDAQGAAVVGEIAAWKGSFSADEITIGIANAAVGPFVKRRLAEHGIIGRDAAGTPLSEAGPLKLLEALGRFLRTRRFSDYANLIRHPDFEDALRVLDKGLEPIDVVDAYHNGHLPEIVDGEWLEKKSSKSDRRLRREMERLWATSLELIGPLWSPGSRELDGLLGELRGLLERVYGAETLDPDVQSQRARVVALKKVAKALDEIESLPEKLSPRGAAHEVLELAQRMLRNEIVPPRAAREDEKTIEMLGWLELPLDNAPALLIVGFEDGHVPQSIRGDAFLPNSLRRNLGLTDDERRLARDLYATELLLNSRKKVGFISGRRSLDGDPQVPSRIVFHCPPEDVVPRVKHFLGGAGAPVPEIQEPSPAPELPRREVDFELTKMSVTDFRLYLGSPYQYYLTKVLGLKTLDDRSRELDPLAFGILAHDVLQRFGEDVRAREESDEKKIAHFLSGELHELAREAYGKRPLPAIHLQIEQLDHRLRVFASKQAEQYANGWRIVHSEWKPEKGFIELEVDGVPVELHGRIDRIDHDPVRNIFAIWDYKSGDRLTRPGTAHRRTDGTWRDLQLPLYCILAAELIGDQPPKELGYASLSKSANEIGFFPIKTWGGAKSDRSGYVEGLEAAYEATLDVVRAIRRGEFIDPEGFDPWDEIFRAIGGLELVEPLESEGEEDAE